MKTSNTGDYHKGSGTLTIPYQVLKDVRAVQNLEGALSVV